MTASAGCVYVVDDDELARQDMLGLFASAGLQAQGFDSASAFLARAEQARPGCLVLDVYLPELNGLELQRRLNASQAAMPIVFVTGRGDVPTSVSAIKAGALDFFTKPFDAEALLDAVGRGLRQAAPRTANAGRPRRCERTAPREEIAGIVGQSEALFGTLYQVRTVAPTESTVLISGETGTGKERIARAVHELSARQGGRFVKVNCAAIPAALLESELMGHEKGAFTGALSQRIGRFELANDGTIFLDEIGELPLELQPKLLRLLQEREFERLGGCRTVRSNARVIAATNRDLRAMVRAGTFREDLYYRLSVFPIRVPPLRERKQDIPLLAAHFTREVSERLRKSPPELTPEVLARLSSYRWPGNIRELQNVVERAVILAQRGVLEVPELVEADAPSGANKPPPSRSPHSLAGISKAHIERVLEETDWVVAGPHGAAARLEMKRSTLSFRMKKLGIVRPGDRSAS